MQPTIAWKLVLAIALGAAIVMSAYARAPHRRLPRAELRSVVLGAIALYAVGTVASLTRHPLLAAVLYAAGIVVSALAAWLSRGNDAGDGLTPPGQPEEEHPPPAPDGTPSFDWTAFQREFESYARRRAREPAGTR